MKLSSLEIKGFKSFGDKVTIHFDEGVTSIVGPNGSGKSNVVDAFRWVLGEQKMRLLRSEKMENIIFNGTKTRKPSNLSEVTLTFVNDKGILPTEFSTVAVTRRLYRSGDSEFLLNGVTCRLKDINNLFLDTGIGPDSYSIIELKMVDDIINDRNDTIKMLLEEAAGISKYKIRKTQTLQKLEETDGDLNRVNDLLFEIEKSLKQLEQQARKTERYYKLKDEYQVSSTALSIFLIKSFREKLIELKTKEEQQSVEKATLVDQLEKLETSIHSLKIATDEKEKALSLAQKQLNEKLLLINRFENEQKSRVERLNYLNDKKNQLHKQVDADSKQVEELTIAIEIANEEKTKEEEKLIIQEQELQQLKLQVESSKATYETANEELKQTNIQLLQARQAINDHETYTAVRQTRINSLSEQIKRVREQVEKDSTGLDSIANELNELNATHHTKEKEIVELKALRVQLEEEIKQGETEVKELRDKLAEERRIADVKNNEYQLTKSLMEQMDGFPESIKFLKKNYDQFKSTPLLSDVLNCKEEYKVAIENYLEPFLNHFVVKNNSDAWEALQLLSENSKGRAHFFVLESLSNFNSTYAESINNCISALEVVDVDSSYQPLFSYLLNNVYILTEDVPLAYAETGKNSSAVVLSKSGKFFKQKYSISGGSVGLFDGKRTGKLKHLEKLQAEIEEHTFNIELYKEQLQKTDTQFQQNKQSLQTNNQTLYLLESELSKAVLQLNTLQSKKDFISSNNEANTKNLSRLEDELAQVENQKNNATGLGDFSLDEMRINLERLTTQQREKQETTNLLQKESSDAGAKYNQQNILYLQQQNKIQNIIRDSGYKNNQLATLKTNIENNNREIEQVNEQINEQANLGNNSEVDLQRHIEERVQFENLLNETEKTYFEGKGQIDFEDRTITDTRRKKEIADELIHAIHNEVNEVNLKFASLKERLNIEFNLNIDELMEQTPDETLNEGELKEKTEAMQNKLKNFGPINPMALESFKEIKERYDFIIKEKEDLAKAKESLLQTIGEIDNSAKEKFLDTYNQVRKNFINVFRTLFTDNDNCDITLSDMNNPLESDIQILAQPKGKKPLSIQQLSGGERTLTATALLFGLYLVKPAPFCIFDEVDAPLDDNNIDKFNNIIKKFSNESQFIIITHNKKTMAATDLIYGITMNEPGVTAVVPVDLREYAE